MPAEMRISFSDGGSSDTVRKLSDELSRKHLSDLIEADEDEVTSSLPERPRSQRKASTSSTFSVASMDTLWEKHPRRLSEAGLRRSSDHSVVLTEDTDSFIIGERVWVGGTKPGQIAYIGETQFAPGEWAGIVLDEAIGKNDGSVAGVRYFQCSEKRGVFSRLTRLTRTPLVSPLTHDASPVSDAGSVFDRPPSGASVRPKRTLSPNGSIRSMVSSKMNASISTTTPSNKEVGIGDRVIVSSSRGSKAGVLRYVGPADFAPGVWAGVELDDPLGKNDGSVDGKRYFECSPRYGLFAPISKVSRSPSNRKPGQCAIHSNGRATPLRRSNSRDSLTSLGTSIASSRLGVRGVPSLGAQRLGGPRASSTPVSAKGALQELLREKQGHLERLMKERDLERVEVAKATLQADRAESALAHIKKEASETSEENVRLKSELDKLQKQLEDERQKVEDLMFRSEEDNINREDYEKYKEAMEVEKLSREQRIRELEAEVSLQESRVSASRDAALALEAQRAADLAATADNHRQELAAAHTLSSELQKLLDEAYALLKEKDNEKDSIGKSMSDELSKVKMESEKALNEAKTKLAIAQTEFDTQISVLTGNLKLAESKLEGEKINLERLNKENSQTIIELNAKISQLQASVDDKAQELNKVTGTSKEHEVNLNKEITKLKMELSAKVLDLEQLTETNKTQEIAYQNLDGEMNRVKQECAAKVTELESIINETAQLNEQNKSVISQLQQSLSVKTKDYERLLNESTTTTSSSEKLINEYKQTIHERDKEIAKLKDEFEQTTANFNVNNSKIAELHKKEVDEQNRKIEELVNEIDGQKKTLDQNKLDFDNLTSQFTNNADELKTLREENDQLKNTIAELTKSNAEAKEKIAAMELEIGECKRQLEGANEKCAEIQKSKDKIEQEYMNLTGKATDSNEQFNQLSQHLKDTEKELQDIKDKHREVLNNYGRIEQELKQKLFKVEEDFSLERTQLVKANNDNTEKLIATEKKLHDCESELLEFKNRLRAEEEIKDKLIDANNNLKKDFEELKVKESEIASENELQRKQMEAAIEKYKQEVSLLKAEGATSEVKLMEKVDQLIEAQNDLNNKLEEARRHEDALQKVIDDMTTRLNNQKSQYEQEIGTIQTKLSTSVAETDALKSEESRLKDLLVEKENGLKELTLKLEMLEVDVKSNVEMSAEKERQLAQASEDLNKATKCKKELEEKLSNSVLETSNIRQLYENLISNSSAGETMLKDQQNQLEMLTKDITVVNQDKIALESKLENSAQELSHLKTEHENTMKKLLENIELNKTLQQSIEEKDRLLKTQTESHEADINKTKALETEMSQIKQDLQTNINLLEQKENELKKLNDLMLTGTSETQQRVQVLQNECEQLNNKYKSDVDALNNSCNSLKSRIAEQDKQLQELQKANEKVKELQALLEKSENDIKQLTSINEGQKSNYEDLNKQLESQCNDYKKECKRIKHDYKARIVEREKEIESSKEKLTLELEKQTQLQQKLEESEKNVVDLSNKLELISVQNSANIDKDDKLQKLTLEMQALRKSSSEELQKCNAEINTLKADVENKHKELKMKEELLAQLTEDLRNNRAKIEIAEREKALLQKELSSRPKEGIIKDKNDNREIGQGDDQSQNTLAEKEILDGQVSFLNSVIVDMQRKNEQLVARVQALESGNANDADNIFAIRTPKAVAPRLFCDICDVFDAHDTEDCERQAAQPPAPRPAGPPQAPHARKPPPAPRPYCDICEVFGHATENCDEEETF